MRPDTKPAARGSAVIAEHIQQAIITAGTTAAALDSRIEPAGFSDRLAGRGVLYVSDVSEAAALMGVSAASLLGV